MTVKRSTRRDREDVIKHCDHQFIPTENGAKRGITRDGILNRREGRGFGVVPFPLDKRFGVVPFPLDRGYEASTKLAQRGFGRGWSLLKLGSGTSASLR
jgi:hypothetical protein